MVLKKEIMKTQSKELEKGAEYRQMLVQVRRPAPLRAPITGNHASRFPLRLTALS